MNMTLFEKVKANLILEHDQDDPLLRSFITAATSYAETFQGLAAGTYATADMPPTTEQAVIMLVCGLTPFSAGSEYRPTLFVGSNSRVTGFSISHQETNGNITNIAQFDKTKIDLIKRVNIENGIYGNGSISITGSITTNSGYANSFQAVNHYRYVSGFGDAQIKFGCGAITASGNTFASAALEMGYNGYSSPSARLDVFPSWGAALMCLRGSSGGGNTGILEMGSTTMWWRGSEIAVNSSADLKADIAPARTALDKILSAGVYTYKYTGDESAETVDAQESTGFVLGKGYTPPPSEVIGEDGASVNLYAIGALAWKGIQELTARVEKLEGGTSIGRENPGKTEGFGAAEGASPGTA